MSNCSEPNVLSALDLELFDGVPVGIIAHVEKQCTWRRIDVNEFIIENNSRRPHGVFFLVKGEAEVFRTGFNKEYISIVKFNAPECFGEFGAVGGKTGSNGVRATTPCVLAEISSERFLGLLNACPAASLYLFEKIASGIKNVDQDSMHHHTTQHRAPETAHGSAALRSW